MNKQGFRASRDVIIQVGDLVRALKFYGETLGLPVSQRYETCTGFEAGGFQLFVEQGAVPDVTAAKQRLLAAGCKIVEEDERVPRLYMRDPYGLTFNIGRSR